jgi:hypothetical protein
MQGVNLTKIYCKHILNTTMYAPVQLLYTNLKKQQHWASFPSKKVQMTSRMFCPDQLHLNVPIILQHKNTDVP